MKVLIVMILGYIIGAILIVFGLVISYEIFTASFSGLQIVYYPFLAIILLIMGAWIWYGVYASGKSKLDIQ